MRAIARYTGATVVGINNNAYQLTRLDTHNKRNGLDHLCSGVKVRTTLSFLLIPLTDVFAGRLLAHALP